MLQEGEMFTVRVGMKGDGMSWGPLLSPTYTHVCEHNHLSLQAHAGRLQLQHAFVCVLARGGRETLNLKPLFPKLEESQFCLPRSSTASLIFDAGADRGN